MRAAGLRRNQHLSRRSARSWARVCALLPRFPCLPRSIMDARATLARAGCCLAVRAPRHRHRRLAPYAGELRGGKIRCSLRGARHRCQSQRRQRPPALSARRLPLLPVSLLLARHRDGHSAAGNGAGSLCASPIHHRHAACASRLPRVARGFCVAAPRASNPDLTDEQQRGTAIWRVTARYLSLSDRGFHHVSQSFHGLRRRIRRRGLLTGIGPALSHVFVGPRFFPATLLRRSGPQRRIGLAELRLHDQSGRLAAI